MEMSLFTYGNRKRGPMEGNIACAAKVPRLVVSDTPLLKFRPKLADFYFKQPEVPEGTWPPVKMTQYINLALIKPKPIDFGNDYVRQTIHGSIDDVIKDKDEITYEDAFNDIDDGALVLLEGRPGCGKTTLMHKLSQDWDKGKVFASHIFVLVHFRTFNNRSDVKLPEILRTASMNLTAEDIQQMCTYIEGNSGKGVVFALDGLDEYTPQTRNSHVLLYSLIQKRYLSNSIVIVASRPAASQKFRSIARKHIEVLGFLKSQIREYIENYYNSTGSSNQAEGLLRYLENHPNVMHMCYLPLHTAMVTYLYKVERGVLPQTETEIYTCFARWTLIRSLRRNNDDPDELFMLKSFDELPEDDKEEFHKILKLAYLAVVLSKQVFTREEIEQLLKSSTGLIVIDRCFVKDGLTQTYTFIHLTFQEYLAAYYISYQSEEEQTEILKKHGSAENFAQVWKYFCGIKRCSLQNFKVLLDETKDESAVTPRRSRKKEFSNMLLHLHCAFESQKESMCTQVVDTYESNISLCNQTLNPSDMTALGYVIINSKTPLKELGIVSCRLGEEGLSALMMEIKDTSLLGVETLSFNGTEIKQDMTRGFASLLNVCQSIRTLNISKCGLQVNTLKGISDGLSKPMHSLTELSIASNPLGVTGSAVKAFMEKLPALETVTVSVKDFLWLSQVRELFQSKNVALRYMKSDEEPLLTQDGTEVDLFNKKIGDIRAQVLCDVIKENTGITKIELYQNNIGDTGAQAIGEGCKSLPNLQHIDLANNQIGDTGAQAIAEGCKACHDLQRIDLSRNNIGDTGAQAIGEGCKSWHNLQHIDLGSNQIGDTGAQAIAEGCKSCHDLQYINLYGNSITDASVPHLVGLMETARKLKTLLLSGNKFTDVGKSQLREAAEKRNSDTTNYVGLSFGV